jgi:hypothetical protein
MAGITSPFANPTENALIAERAKDVVIGSARVSYCRIRGGWAKIGGGMIKHYDDVLLYASKINENAQLWEQQSC